MKRALSLAYGYIALAITSVLNILFISRVLATLGCAFPDSLARFYPTRVIVMNHKSPADAARNVAWFRMVVFYLRIAAALGVLSALAYWVAGEYPSNAQLVSVIFMVVGALVGSVIGAVFGFRFRRRWEQYRGNVILDAARRPARSSANVSRELQAAEERVEPDGYDRPVKKIHLPGAFFEYCKTIVEAMKNPDP